MSDKLESRVAVLEHIAGEADEDMKTVLLRIAKHMEDEDERWDAVCARLTKMEKLFDKYKSFLGGVIFTVSALWGIFIFAIKYFGWFKINGS